MTELICICCPSGCHLSVDEDNDYKVTGNGCERGAEYGKSEVKSPVRVLTSTIEVKGGEIGRCPVKTNGAIPKGKIFDAQKKVQEVCLNAPINLGDVIIENICDTGINVIATKTVGEK